jgi:hypothetical protein
LSLGDKLGINEGAEDSIKDSTLLGVNINIDKGPEDGFEDH